MKKRKSQSVITYARYFIIILCLTGELLFGQKNKPVKLSWLGDEAPGLATGVSWGVPFTEGQLKPSSGYILKNEQGNEMPVQSWPLAFWPDGSVKWLGLSTVSDSAAGNVFELQPVNKPSAVKGTKIEVMESADHVSVNTGVLQCRIPKSGHSLITSIMVNGSEIASAGRLLCINQNGPEPQSGALPSRDQFIGNTEKVTVEQKGPVRAVVKIEGRHVSANGGRTWLPFVIRLYFYTAQQSVKMVHTIIYDGDQQQDFIRGLGLVFDIPLDEQMYNRHVRFSGEDGRLWDEPCQPLNGSYPLFVERDSQRVNLYEAQLKGRRIAERETFSERQQFLLDNWASWNDFKLQQLNADGFTVEKRTNEASAWIGAGYGGRSEGMVFVGDVSGGLAVCVKDFWQSFPSALEVNNVRSNTAQLKAWLWSPEAGAMDMRHYDTLAWGHTLAAVYEDVQPGLSIATGVARTTEITLLASADVPSYKTLSNFTRQGNNPLLLTASPEYMHSVPAFGIWSLPDRSTKGKRWIEDQLDSAFKYYQLEVEQRHWYGFWNYGDVRHGYDWNRHTWKYDMGGYAWDNAELMPNMWLWYAYLRSGRADIYRMAEAMTRHTGEVDVYHLGRLNGLGSRHNVIHWGGGAKEVRISQAALGRFLYYLTTDERTGDLMRASVEAANEAIGKLDPLRLILEKSEYPTHARFGPDWLALVSNWMTEWERTGDTQYRDRILVGVNNLYDMPYGTFSGVDAAFGYDPATYSLHQLKESDIGYRHLSVLMGGPEVAFELTPILQNEKWDKLWLQFCRIYASGEEIAEKEFGRKVKLGDPGPWYARLPAYYARETGDKDYAARAWEMFFDADSRWQTDFDMQKFESIESLQPVYEIRGVSTNNTAQWCLNAIEILELIGDQLPEDNPRIQNAE